jgi:hypothetical protein
MTNKTTPDDDWLDEILNTLELKIIPEEGYIAPKVHAEAKQAINAKITELLVAELERLTTSEVDTTDIERFEYQHDGLPMLVIQPRQIEDRIRQLQASQSINPNESEKL